jgi:hypothetical protein
MPHVKDEDKVTAYHVEANLKMAYIRTRRDPDTKVLDGFVTLLGHSLKGVVVLPVLLQDAADLIRSLFTMRYVMIGLKGRDGTYRYAYMSGMRDDSWAAHRKKVYTLESFSLSVPGWYRAAAISDLTRIYLEENNPLGPGYETSVNRPALLSMKRVSVESSLEADFFNTLIKGPRDELLGWIEYPGTVGGKLPDVTMIRNIEVVASILAAAIVVENRMRRAP